MWKNSRCGSHRVPRAPHYSFPLPLPLRGQLEYVADAASPGLAYVFLCGYANVGCIDEYRACSNPNKVCTSTPMQFLSILTLGGNNNWSKNGAVKYTRCGISIGGKVHLAGTWRGARATSTSRASSAVRFLLFRHGGFPFTPLLCRK